MMNVNKMTIIFNCAGLDSEEEFDVLSIEDEIVTLATDEETDKCKKFNMKTGKCINDATAFGASRRLKL